MPLSSTSMGTYTQSMVEVGGVYVWCGLIDSSTAADKKCELQRIVKVEALLPLMANFTCNVSTPATDREEKGRPCSCMGNIITSGREAECRHSK